MAGVMKVAYTSLKQFSGLCESSINMKEVIFWPTSLMHLVAVLLQAYHNIGSLYYPCKVTDQLTRPSSLKKLDENNFSKHKPGYFLAFVQKNQGLFQKTSSPLLAESSNLSKQLISRKKTLRIF